MKEEASGVAKYLQALCSEGFEPKDILVLVPRKLLAKGLRAALKDAGVPHHSFYQEEALDSNAAQLAFCLLTLLAFPGDRVALRYWLGSGSKTWRRAEYGKLRTHCENTGESPGEALERAARGLVTIAGVSTLVARYTELYGRLTAMKDLTTLELVNELTKEGDLETDLLRDLLETAASKYETTAKLVDHVRTAVSQPEPAEDANCVRIMSLQKSKGLTSRAVVLAGCIESFLPKVNTSDTIAEQEESVREQRRLFYVAITRPKERLIISSFRTMPAGESYTTGAKVSGKYGNGYTLPSRFIDELGPTAPKAVAGSKWIFESFG